MFFWNRRKQLREAEAAEQAQMAAKAARDAEQLRLGRILFEKLRPIVEQNKNACGGEIYIARIEQNGGDYSVMIMYQSGSHRECMQQFSVRLAKNELTAYQKYNRHQEFALDEFDQFLETAIGWVRDFR